ncbi:MAG: amidase family protein, partial [Anaerolineales bacterium]
MKQDETPSLIIQRDLIKSKEVNVSDLASACYKTIERLNPILNAFITVTPPEKKDLPSNGSMPLYGIPLAVKDLYDVKGIRTTGGSKFFENNIAKEDAFVIQKIKKAGGIIIGKTNTHEIALGVTNNTPHVGACRN